MKFECTYFLSLLILCLFKKYVSAIRCYVCRSDEDKNCAGDAKHLGDYVRTCNEEGSGAFCRSIHQQVFFMEDSHRVVIRECAYIYEKETCYNSVWPDVKVLTCDCARDLCNYGTRSVGNGLGFLLIIQTVWAFISLPEIALC